MNTVLFWLQFRCSNGDCIPGHLQCSGQPECKDGSDERNCRKFVLSVLMKTVEHKLLQLLAIYTAANFDYTFSKSSFKGIDSKTNCN